MSNRRPHSGHSPVSPRPPRSYTQPTHARPAAARTARLIRAVRQREYQIIPNVVVRIVTGIPGRAHSCEIQGATPRSRKGAATAPRAVQMNTAAIRNSYRRKAGGSGAGVSVGVEATPRWYRRCAARRRSGAVVRGQQDGNCGRAKFKSPQHQAQVGYKVPVWSAAIELPFSNANPGRTKRKPVDALIEGLCSETSRRESTPIELFLAGVRVWEFGIRRSLSTKAVQEAECGEH